MSNWKVGPGGRLYHPTTGAYVGQLDDNGNEQMVVSAFPSGEGIESWAAGAPAGLIPTRRLPLAFWGDSRTMGSVAVQPQGFTALKKPWWVATTINFTNLGGGAWIGGGLVDGFAPSGAAGTLQTDGTGKLQWAYSGDMYGPLVDVSSGGFFLLQSGTSPYGILVYVRGGTAAPPAGTGAVTTTGNPGIGDWTMYGYSCWVAGMLGDAFPGYEHFGINGSNTTDLLLRADQHLVKDYDAIVIHIGTNDSPTTAASAQATAARITSIVDKALTRANRVYVVDEMLNGVFSTAQKQYMALAMKSVADYCETKSRTRFCSAYDLLVSQTGLPTSQRAGAYNADTIHLVPWGAYLAASRVVDMIRADFRLQSGTNARRAGNYVYDSTFKTGAWNANPTLRGTSGTVTGSAGITGTAPDSWTLSRGGSAQLCTTSFDTAADGGLPFFSMAVSNGTTSNYHELTQTFSVPAGIAVGDAYKVSCEMCIYGATTPGLAIFSVAAVHNQANTVQQIDTLATLSSRNLDTFATENPVLRLTSTPCILDTVANTITLRIRVGGANGGGAGKIGFREFKIEKA